MLALLSGASTAHTPLLHSSSAFHAAPAPSSVHRIQQEFAGLDAEDLIGTQGEPISVKIKLPSPPRDREPEAGTTRFLIFRGLPAALVLSAGFLTRSSWVVSVADLSSLRLLSAPDYQGAFLIEVTAHSTDGQILARATVPIVITPGRGDASQAASLVETGREDALAAHTNMASTESNHSDQQLRTAFEVFLNQYAEHGSDGAPKRLDRDALYAEFVRWWINTHLRDAE